MPGVAYRLMVPAGWLTLPLGDGRDEAIEEIAAEAVASMPRDSSAVARHRYRGRLAALAEELASDTGSSMDVVYFPRPGSGADLIPMTLSCGTVPELTIEAAEATRFLVTVAQQNDTAKPTDADGVVALRTHSFSDVGAVIAEEITAATGESVAEPPLRQLRATYLFAEPTGATWHLVVASATVPAEEPDEAPVADALLSLFDAMLATLKWEAREPAHA